MITKRVKFFLTPVYPWGNDHYYHKLIGLAEGFSDLGYKINGNCNYWWEPEKKDFLIKENDSGDFDIAIYDFRYVKSFEHLLFRKGYPNFDFSKIHILIDFNYWISPIWLNKNYRIFDFIFSANLHANIKYPDNVFPWAMGLTNRVIKSIDKFSNPNETIEYIIGHNFRVPHNLRKYLLNELQQEIKKIPFQLCITDTNSNEQKKIEASEIDNFYWLKTTRRHNPEFYQLLNKKLIFLTFGGYYEFKPHIFEPYSIIDKIRKKPYYYYSKFLTKFKSDISPAHFIFQYDSFRFWEVLYSRSCPINVDFESWNLLLPEMPVNGRHYLGINKFNFKLFAEQLESLSVNQIMQIGIQGRDWALANYSPTAQAQRIITAISNKNNNS